MVRRGRRVPRDQKKQLKHVSRTTRFHRGNKHIVEGSALPTGDSCLVTKKLNTQSSIFLLGNTWLTTPEEGNRPCSCSKPSISLQNYRRFWSRIPLQAFGSIDFLREMQALLTSISLHQGQQASGGVRKCPISSRIIGGPERCPACRTSESPVFLAEYRCFRHGHCPTAAQKHKFHCRITGVSG